MIRVTMPVRYVTYSVIIKSDNNKNICWTEVDLYTCSKFLNFKATTCIQVFFSWLRSAMFVDYINLVPRLPDLFIICNIENWEWSIGMNLGLMIMLYYSWSVHSLHTAEKFRALIVKICQYYSHAHIHNYRIAGNFGEH